MGAAPVVRLATADDVPVLTGLRLAFKDSDGTVPAQRRMAIAADLEHNLAGSIASGEVVAILAESDGVVVSTAWLSFAHLFNGGLTATLFNVWTPPKWRRRGFARVAVLAAMDEARRRGAVQIDLMASDEGYQLYESLGWRRNPQPAMRLELSDVG